MKWLLMIISFLVILGLFTQASGANRRIIPVIDSPQDALDAAVFIPEAGIRVALTDFDEISESGSFVIIKNGEVIDFENRDNIRSGENLRLYEDCDSYVLEAALNGVELIFSCPYSLVVVVVNDIDLGLSPDFPAFLDSNDVEVIVASAAEFNDYTDVPNIIILGGPDALEGVGNIARQVLSEEEIAHLRGNGNMGFFEHDSPWTSNPSTVIVIAGADRFLTQRSVQQNKDKIIF
jgi:hypothetical protein